VNNKVNRQIPTTALKVKAKKPKRRVRRLASRNPPMQKIPNQQLRKKEQAANHAKV